MIYVAGLIAFIPLLAGEILALASRKERAADHAGCGKVTASER
ncbi:MAG: hypothetical protein DDT25_00512 [Chloroflexi bacterium]|nr:hypothetical protein [Chloroflexota bacterium]